MIEKFRQQLSSQESLATSAAKPPKRVTDSHPELPEPRRRTIDPKGKNSNSSSDRSKPATRQTFRTGRKVNTDQSTSSERKELGGGIGMPLITRKQLASQARQQRMNSHNRVHYNNLAIAPLSNGASAADRGAGFSDKNNRGSSAQITQIVGNSTEATATN